MPARRCRKQNGQFTRCRSGGRLAGLGATTSRTHRAPHARASHHANGTWIEPEAMAYTARAGGGGRGSEGFSGGRRARARNEVTGKYTILTIGIPDTAFSIPVKGGGFISMSDGEVVYTPSRKS